MLREITLIANERVVLRHNSSGSDGGQRCATATVAAGRISSNQRKVPATSSTGLVDYTVACILSLSADSICTVLYRQPRQLTMHK